MWSPYTTVKMIRGTFQNEYEIEPKYSFFPKSDHLMTSIYLTLNLQTGQASIDYTDSKSNNHTTTAPPSGGNAWTKQLTQDLTKSRELHELSQDGVEMRYDSTGMFHWCTPRRIAEAEITKEQCAQLNLQVRYYPRTSSKWPKSLSSSTSAIFDHAAKFNQLPSMYFRVISLSVCLVLVQIRLRLAFEILSCRFVPRIFIITN